MGYQSTPDIQGDFVAVWLTPKLLEALDNFAAEREAATRADALREAFTHWCVDQGYFGPNDIDPHLN